MFIVVTPKSDGSHDWDAVGPFTTEVDARVWRDDLGDGIIKPMIAPIEHLTAREQEEGE